MNILKTLAGAAVLLSATAASAADEVGEALAVLDRASASGRAGERQIEVGSPVFVGDLIMTDALGQAQLLFSDGTRMIVGSNSSLVIDEFLFRANASDNKFAVRALGGAFRFISGAGGDQGYAIRTPSASIGVKGTAIDFTVVPGAGGATRLILLEGEATLCRGDVDVGRTEAGDGECATAATPCAVLQTSGDEDKRVEEIGIDQGRKQTTIENFPYVRSESTLLEDFKVAGHGCADGGLAGGGLPGTSIPVEPVIVTTVGVAAILFILLTGDSTDSNNNTND